MIGVRTVVTPQAASAALSVLLTLLILGAAVHDRARPPQPQQQAGPTPPAEAPATAPAGEPDESTALALTQVPLPPPPPSSAEPADPAGNPDTTGEEVNAPPPGPEAKREPPTDRPAARPTVAPAPLTSDTAAPEAIGLAPEPAGGPVGGQDTAAPSDPPAARAELPAFPTTTTAAPPPIPRSNPADAAQELEASGVAPERAPSLAPPATTVRAHPEPEAPSSPPAPSARAIEPDATARRHGRALLRLLENGGGPSIELIWPDEPGHRDRLAERLRRCYGTRDAIMAASGALFTLDSPPGRPWALDLDRYSGFVRQPASRLTPTEQAAHRAIQAHHRGRASGQLVRVMRREVDALLLGGLRRLLGGDAYGAVGQIRARYRLDGSDVVIDGITADGRPVSGEISLAAASLCRAA